MARTSNRRWKGCPMCKPHKIAGNGDAERMRYSARKAFPSRKGKSASAATTPASGVTSEQHAGKCSAARLLPRNEIGTAARP
jgi:hypothetical protein